MEYYIMPIISDCHQDYLLWFINFKSYYFSFIIDIINIFKYFKYLSLMVLYTL